MSEPPERSTILFRAVPSRLPRRRLRTFAAELSRTVARGRPFECLISDNEEVRRLNLAFRRQDSSTDVLSFPSGVGTAYLGEIAISWQRAAEQARERGHALEEEIQVLMLHGLLHLLGYDHETDGGAMRRVEYNWRRKLGLRAGLIERAQA